MRSTTLAWSLLGMLAGRSVAQQVTIPGATPTAVVDHLKAQLGPQGFVLEDANDKAALFVLDRGLVSQGATAAVPVVHVFIELQLKFQQKRDGLLVRANEEVVGNRGKPLEFRKPADSDRPNVQRLLESVKSELTSSPVDTTKRDSTSH